MIFFLDDSPLELRSIVEFLNGQLKDVEGLIVEARQYQHRDARIVVPWVFGFTEEARVAKRDSKAETARSSPAKGEAAFWEAIEASGLNAEWKDDLHDFVAGIGSAPGCELRWRVTCLIDLPGVVPQKTLLSVNRDGSLQLYLASWEPKDGGALTEQQSTTKEEFFTRLQGLFDFSAEDSKAKQLPTLSPDRWIPHAVILAEVIKHLGTFSVRPAEIVEE